MEISKEFFEDACSKIAFEIDNLTKEVGLIDTLLSPYKGYFISGTSGLHGSYRNKDLDVLSKFMDKIREQSDKLRALRISCSTKLEKSIK